jgi:hypothetical protein
MADLIFEAVCTVSGIDWQEGMTSDQRGRVNAAVKQLRDLYGEAEAAVPMMIHERAAAWALVYPEIPMTPQVLTGNWSTILNAAEHKQAQVKEDERAKRRETNAHAKSGCETCGDDHVVTVGQDADGYDLTAPCPDCNLHANASYWVERRRIEVMDAAKTREMLGR